MKNDSDCDFWDFWSFELIMIQITAQLVNSYKALIEIVQEDLSGENITDANGTRERQFADDYLDEATNSAGSMRMKKRIIDGSRRFLEKL